MNSHKRAELLYIKAEKEGLEAPTESQVAMEIHMAEEDILILNDIIMALKSKGFGYAADYLKRVRKLNS